MRADGERAGRDLGVPVKDDEFVFRVEQDKAETVQRVTLAEQGLKEREHLQEWVLAHPAVLGDGVEVVASEFDRWQTAAGDPVLDRLDVLGIDRNGRLVVAELKRDDAPHFVHVQAINYAAMVSRLTPEDVADLYAATRTRQGQTMDRDAALEWLTTQRLMTTDSLRNPRIVLVATDFPPSVTASTVWLSERGVSISLLRYRAYRLGDGQVVVSFSRVYPLTDVEEFMIGRRAEPVEHDVTPTVPWDADALRRLAKTGNTATLTLLDLCAAEEAAGVSVQDIAGQADLTAGQVRGQLAGFTMLLRNPKYGFTQKRWPVDVRWSGGGVASYEMPKHLAALWRQIRAADTTIPVDQPLSTPGQVGGDEATGFVAQVDPENGEGSG